jgi:hypothetical protein
MGGFSSYNMLDICGTAAFIKRARLKGGIEHSREGALALGAALLGFLKCHVLTASVRLWGRCGKDSVTIVDQGLQQSSSG